MSVMSGRGIEWEELVGLVKVWHHQFPLVAIVPPAILACHILSSWFFYSPEAVTPKNVYLATSIL